MTSGSIALFRRGRSRVGEINVMKCVMPRIAGLVAIVGLSNGVIAMQGQVS